MSYETNFSVIYNFDNDLTIDSLALSSSIRSALEKNYELIHFEGCAREVAIDDWFDFIVRDDGIFQSNNYSNVNMLLQVAVQIITDGLADSIAVELMWEGEESGDYTENIYKVTKSNGSIKVSYDREIRRTEEVEVNLTDNLDRMH